MNDLRKLYIEPTNACNLSCRTCMRNAWDEPPGFMPLTTFQRVLRDARELARRAASNALAGPRLVQPDIFFGGYGEPLAHPEIVQMVVEAKALGGTVELITNGTLLDDEIAVGLVDAGLDRLWVSLDGARPESYADVRLGAALPEVLANITRFRRLCLPSLNRQPELGIAFVAMKRNIADLPALLTLATKLGASRILVTNLLPHTAELRDEILYAHALKDITYLESPQVPQISLPRIDIDETTASGLYEALRSHRNVSFAGNNLGSAVGRCPFIDAGAAAIAWNGNLSPCLPLLHDHASYLGRRLRRVQHYAVGNVVEQSLETLWLHPEHQAFRERVRRSAFSPCAYCGGCERSLANLEDCFGNTFPTCGGCLWAQGVIRCP